MELKKDGYFSRQLKISIKEGFRLNVSATLALDPFPAVSKKLPSPNSSITVFDLSGSGGLLASDPSVWVSGVAFWASRKEGTPAYKFFLTTDGNVFDVQGSQVSLTSLTKATGSVIIGYLGEGSGTLSAAARKALDTVSTKLYPTSPRVQILDTGIGYLKVRSGPGKNYSVIGKATVGSKYTYLEEQSGWYKISFQGKTGWVSADYVRRL